MKLYWQKKTKALAEKRKNSPSATHFASGTKKATRSPVTQLNNMPEITEIYYKYPSNSAEDSLLSDSIKRLYQPAVQASGFQTVNLIFALNGPQNGSPKDARCKWNKAVTIHHKGRS